jgi:hypothetical protein
MNDSEMEAILGVLKGDDAIGDAAGAATGEASEGGTRVHDAAD